MGDVMIQSFIKGNLKLLIQIRPDALVKELIIEFCKKTGFDASTVEFIYQGKKLDENSRIADCRLYAESAIAAVSKRVTAPPPAIRMRRTPYNPPDLPAGDNDYFVYCPKHATDNLQEAGRRPFCVADQETGIEIKTGTARTWEATFSPTIKDIVCHSEEKNCTKRDTPIGYYFVCQGKIEKDFWSEEDSKYHPGDYHTRTICKSFSFCKNSNFTIVDVVTNKVKKLPCQLTGKVEDKMIQFSGCGHIYTIDALRHVFLEANDSLYLMENTSSNQCYFGKYVIACPFNRFQCDGYDGDPGAILLSTLKVISRDLYHRTHKRIINLDYLLIVCESNKHHGIPFQFQGTDHEATRAQCPGCNSDICVKCGKEHCIHNQKSYQDTILDIILTQKVIVCPFCSESATINRGLESTEMHCAGCRRVFCMYCSVEDNCENDCYDKYHSNAAARNQFKDRKQLDLLRDLYLKYKADSPTNTLASWEAILADIGEDAALRWQDTKLLHNTI